MEPGQGLLPPKRYEGMVGPYRNDRRTGKDTMSINKISSPAGIGLLGELNGAGKTGKTNTFTGTLPDGTPVNMQSKSTAELPANVTHMLNRVQNLSAQRTQTPKALAIKTAAKLESKFVRVLEGANSTTAAAA
jgi:hypothetical protein